MSAHRLRAEVESLVAHLAAFEPRRHSVDDCTEVVAVLARLQKAAAATATRAAARAADRGAHQTHGFAQASEWLARETGTSAGEAERALAVARELDALPATSEALRTGALSLAQAHEVVTTVAACPVAEADLLQVATTSSLRTLRDEGRKRRLAAVDPGELHRRQHAARFHRHWRDETGMIRYSGAMVPEAGVPFTNRMDAETDREWRAAYRNGTPERREQHAADAFQRIVSGSGQGRAVRADVVYVCDVASDACHVVGGGPVRSSVVRDAVRAGAFVKAVVHDGVQIDTVAHYGRHIPAVLRTALELGEPPDFDGVQCCEPGCDRTYGLEWDHVDPVANGGVTARSNFKPRCRPCHAKKTERDRLAGLLDGGRKPARARGPAP